MANEIVKATYEVLNTTYESIKHNAENMSLTEGQVIDYFLTKMQPKNKGIAKMLMNDYLFLTLKNLSEDDATEVLITLMVISGVLIAQDEKYNNEKIFEFVKKTISDIVANPSLLETADAGDMIEEYNKYISEKI